MVVQKAKCNVLYKALKGSQITLSFIMHNYLVKKLSQGLVAFALVADFRSRYPAGARVDVRRAVLLTRVIQVTGFGSIQTVVLLCGWRLS